MNVTASFVSGLIPIAFLLITLVACGTTKDISNVPIKNKDLILTASEKHALDKLKARVQSKVPNDYMKTDVYLSMWLRDASGNVDVAEQRLQESLIWRKKNRLDTILHEDFSGMEEEYPTFTNGVDKEGRPVLLLPLAQWDMRKAHLTGESEKVYRYAMKAMEVMCQKVRDAQKVGKPVTRFQVIEDMSGFNLKTHACIPCMSTYFRYIVDVEKYYPLMVENIIIINAPTTFESVMNSLRPIISPNVQKILKVFGTNKNEWGKVVYSMISKDQLDI